MRAILLVEVPDTPTLDTMKTVSSSLPGCSVEVVKILDDDPPVTSNGSPWVPNGLGNDPWTTEELAKLSAGTTPTTKLVTKMIDVLAENPDIKYPTSELVELLDVSRLKLRGTLSALTRHLKKHYAGHGWPFGWDWGVNLGDGFLAETYYHINPEVGSLWIGMRGSC